MICNLPPRKRYYHRDPNIEALKRRCFVNQGSTLRFRVAELEDLEQGLLFMVDSWLRI